jgi:hypothetical protein
MKDVQYVSVTSLRPGDVVYAHGGVFEIISTGYGYMRREDGASAYGSYADFVGPSPVAVPVGKFIGGQEVTGYFGPTKDWTFQGNHRHVVAIKPRTH